MHLIRQRFSLSKYILNGGIEEFLGNVSSSTYGDLRNQCARMLDKSTRLSRSAGVGGGCYYTLTNTGLDVVVKRCSGFAPVKAAYTKAVKSAEHELNCLMSEDYRSYCAKLPGLFGGLSWDAIRMRRKRLLDRLKSFSAFSGHCYFFTITSRDGGFASVKENFLYAFENARKRYQSLYGKMHYVGVLERHPKRNKHPFHAHFCAFFESGYKKYEELWDTFGKDLGRIDLQPVGKGINGLADYSYKSFLGTITAYLNKVDFPESIMLSSKGSPKPVRKYPTEREVSAMSRSGEFEDRVFVLPTGGEISYMYSDSWPEMEAIFKELSYLDRLEDELRAAEFMKPQPQPTHRR